MKSGVYWNLCCWGYCSQILHQCLLASQIIGASSLTEHRFSYLRALKSPHSSLAMKHSPSLWPNHLPSSNVTVLCLSCSSALYNLSYAPASWDGPPGNSKSANLLHQKSEGLNQTGAKIQDSIQVFHIGWQALNFLSYLKYFPGSALAGGRRQEMDQDTSALYMSSLTSVSTAKMNDCFLGSVLA